MCLGSPDLKEMTRATEERLSSFPRVERTRESNAALPAFGLVAWLRAVQARLKWKDERHV
jgi:hypothetical protein